MPKATVRANAQVLPDPHRRSAPASRGREGGPGREGRIHKIGAASLQAPRG